MKTLILKYIALGLAMTTATQAMALTSSYYSKNSVLSSGNWVKIAVSHEGIQQITPSQLKEWGFSDPSKVKVYGYGGTALCNSTYSTDMPDDLTPTLSMVTDDGRILFYGIADVQVSSTIDSSNNRKYIFSVDRNTYSTRGYYFLTDNDNAASASQNLVPFNSMSTATVLDNHLAIVFDEEEVYNPAAAGAVFMGRQVPPTQPLTFTAKIRDYSYGAPYFGYAYLKNDICAGLNVESGYFTYKATYPDNFYISASSNPSVTATNSSEKTAVRGSGYAILNGNETNYVIADGEYTFSFSVGGNSKVDYGAFDRSYLVYPRNNVMSADDPTMTMFVTQISQGYNFRIANATPQTCVWTIDSPLSILSHQLVYDETEHTVKGTFAGAYLSTSPLGRIVAFEPSATHLSVEYCGPVAPQNLHGLDTPNLLIITTPGLYAEAENLAQMHRDNDGITVAVVTQEQVFNEFSSGTPAAHAYRRLAKMFYDRNFRVFKNMLLYGSGSWDNRNLQIAPPAEQLLTYQAEYHLPKTTASGYDASSMIFNKNTNFCSDTWFGMLDDNFTTEALLNRLNSVRIGVGRLPVTSVAEARRINTKIQSIMQNPLTPNTILNAVLLSDVKKAEPHVTQSEQIGDILAGSNGNITLNRAHALLYPRDRSNMVNVLSDMLNRGMGYFSYTGHGGPTTLGTVYPLWTNTDVNEQSYTQYPFAMLSTCDTYDFDRQSNTLVTNMVCKLDGGAMGAIGAGRTVEMNKNQYLNISAAEVYSESRGKITMGELFRNIINRANSRTTDWTQQTRANTLSYNLCGDPALVMNFPKPYLCFDVTTTDDDTEVTQTVEPLNKFTVSGYVIDDMSRFDDTFNGIATVTFYDSPYQVTGIKVDSTEPTLTTTLDQTPLTTVSTPVVDGKFSVELIVPYPNHTDYNNRVLVTAINDMTGEAVMGTSRDYKLSATATTVEEIVGPTITELYLDSPEFVENQIIGSEATVCASVNVGSAGLSVNSALGAGSKVIIDGKKTLTGAAYALHNNGDGTASMTFKVSQLTDGHHKLTLSVADPMGNRDERSIAFVVNTSAPTLTLCADRLTARTEVELTLSSTAPQADATLVVRDSKGNTVLEQPGITLPFTWDLKANGSRLPDGIYHAHLRYPASPLTVVEPCTVTVIK